MSGKQVGKVLAHNFKPPEEKVMIALAEHANDDGTNIRPGIVRLRWETGYSRTSILRIMKSLRKSGVLVQTRNPGPGRPSRYRFDWTKAEPKMSFDEFYEQETGTPLPPCTGPTYTGPDTSITGPISDPTGPTQVAPKPSYNPSSYSFSNEKGQEDLSEKKDGRAGTWAGMLYDRCWEMGTPLTDKECHQHGANFSRLEARGVEREMLFSVLNTMLGRIRKGARPSPQQIYGDLQKASVQTTKPKEQEDRTGGAEYAHLFKEHEDIPEEELQKKLREAYESIEEAQRR